MPKETVNKYIYKYLILFLKVIPYIIAFAYAFSTIIGFFGIHFIILGYFIHLAILPWFFFLFASIAFRFCKYHRLPLYYIMSNDILVVADTYLLIPIGLLPLLLVHLGLIVLFILLYIYLKFKT